MSSPPAYSFLRSHLYYRLADALTSFSSAERVEGLPADPEHTRKWSRGANVPHISRGHGSQTSVTPAVAEILGNMHFHLNRDLNCNMLNAFTDNAKYRSKRLTPIDLIGSLLSVKEEHIGMVDAVIAKLAGMRPRTVANNVHLM